MKEIAEVFRGAIESARSPESKEIYLHLYGMGRVVLGIFLHPVASFKAHMLIGDEETINRNLDRALSLPKFPKFPIGRQRFQR